MGRSGEAAGLSVDLYGCVSFAEALWALGIPPFYVEKIALRSENKKKRSPTSIDNYNRGYLFYVCTVRLATRPQDRVRSKYVRVLTAAKNWF